jgi:hypothetical protein
MRNSPGGPSYWFRVAVLVCDACVAMRDARRSAPAPGGAERTGEAT